MTTDQTTSSDPERHDAAQDDAAQAASMPAANYAPLRRRRDDRILAGVTHGLAHRLGVDPVLVRIAFGLGLFAGGASVVLYLVLWVAMPPEEGWDGQVGQGLSDGVVGKVLALAFGAALIVGGLGVLSFFLGGVFPVRAAYYHTRSLVGGVLVPVLLIGAGAVAFTMLGRRQQRGPQAGSMSGPSIATPNDSPQAVQPTQRLRSSLGLVTVGTALLVLGIAISVNAAGLARLSVGTIATLLLVVLGAGLAVGAFWGRARWLFLLVIPVAAVAFIGRMADSLGFDDYPVVLGQYFTDVSPSVQPDPIYAAFAEQYIDVPVLERDTDLEVGVAFGQVIIVVGDSFNVAWDIPGAASNVAVTDYVSSGQVDGVPRISSERTSGSLMVDEDAPTLSIVGAAHFANVRIERQLMASSSDEGAETIFDEFGNEVVLEDGQVVAWDGRVYDPADTLRCPQSAVQYLEDETIRIDRERCIEPGETSVTSVFESGCGLESILSDGDLVYLDPDRCEDRTAEDAEPSIQSTDANG